ncbi:methionine synthase [Jannaschia sp. R86511]|uniref:methionine synthase n=1 Tax=Jannaschia sp. R86511 TaxID=3093853 RepID=UPI0036D42547
MSLPAGPWATAHGPLPGTRPDHALDLVLGELGAGHVPFLPVLPERGVGADAVGRSASFLVDLPVDLQPSGWRLVDRPGRDLARGRSWWGQDLDALAERGEEVGRAQALVVGVMGPWTLAASLQRQRGEVAVSDPGARRDVVSSLAEGLADVLAAVRRAAAGVPVVLLLDEPSLPSVLLGRVPTASGYDTLRAVPPNEVRDGLRLLVDAAHATGAAVVLRCHAEESPVGLLAESGADGLGVHVPATASGANAPAWERLAALVEQERTLLLAPTGGGAAADAEQLAGLVTGPWSQVGMDHELLRFLSLTAQPADAERGLQRADLARTARAAELLRERV